MKRAWLELVRRCAVVRHSNKWLLRVIPKPLEHLLSKRLFTTDYALYLNEKNMPVKNTLPESDYRPSYPWKVGIIKDQFWNHTSYIAACRELKVAYSTIDLFRSDWIDQISDSGCDAFLVWPCEFLFEWKKLYDERLWFLSVHLNKIIYPPFEALWLYGSKERQQDWLEIHGFPHAKTRVFYILDEALGFLENAKYPLLVKLDIGTSAHGIWIVHTTREAKRLLIKVFTKGVVGKRADARARQWRHILFQEFIPNVREWRIIRIGDSYFGHEKGKADQFHSGSGVVGWYDPPRQALELIHEVTECGSFRSMDMDVFETADGHFLINELQSVFGAVDTAQMYINGVPGRYRRIGCDFVFEEGKYCRNACCNLRVEDLLQILSCSVIDSKEG